MELHFCPVCRRQPDPAARYLEGAVLEPAPADPGVDSLLDCKRRRAERRRERLGWLHRPIVAKPGAASGSYPQLTARAPN